MRLAESMRADYLTGKDEIKKEIPEKIKKKCPPIIEKRSKTDIEEDLRKMQRDIPKKRKYQGFSRDLMSIEQQEEHDQERWKEPSKLVPVEEVPAPDSNPEEFEKKRGGEIKFKKIMGREEVEVAQQQVEDERRQRREAEREGGWVPENPPLMKLTPEKVQEKLEKISSDELLSLVKQRKSKRAWWWGRRERKRPPHTPEYKTSFRENLRRWFTGK